MLFGTDIDIEHGVTTHRVDVAKHALQWIVEEMCVRPAGFDDVAHDVAALTHDVAESDTVLRAYRFGAGNTAVAPFFNF